MRKTRVVPPPKENLGNRAPGSDRKSAFHRIRDGGVGSSPLTKTTEDSEDNAYSSLDEKSSRSGVPSKLPPFKGGTRATGSLEVILNKLPETVEKQFKQVKNGELNPLVEFSKRQRRADQELHHPGALRGAPRMHPQCHSDKSSLQHEANTLFNRVTSHKEVINRSARADRQDHQWEGARIIN